MIAKLTGIVDHVDDGTVVIDVGGVGYRVCCSGRTLGRLGVGGTASLQVETHVRDDAIVLYGFADSAERTWFRLLTQVQGVGAKVALAILSVLSVDDLTLAIGSGDRAALGRAPGVGSRLAARVVAELRDKIGTPVTGSAPSVAGTAPEGKAGDAVSALVNLGFRPAEAWTAVTAATNQLGAEADAQALIRLGLATLTPKEHAR